MSSTTRTSHNLTQRERIAQLISLVFHPFIVAPFALVLVTKLDGSSWVSALAWSAVCAMLVILPALLYMAYNLARKQYTDADISVREDRYGIYAFGTACMALCLAALFWLEAPKSLLKLLSGAFATIVVFALMTRFWTKVSVHVGLLSAATMAVAFQSLPLGALLGAITLLVGWSRWVLNRHSLAEMVAGWATSSLIIGLTLAFA